MPKQTEEMEIEETIEIHFLLVICSNSKKDEHDEEKEEEERNEKKKENKNKTNNKKNANYCSDICYKIILVINLI